MSGHYAAEHHHLAASGIGFYFEPECGFIGDLAIEDSGRVLRPMHRVPWFGDPIPVDALPHLRRMEGDFFCAPFGDGAGTAPVLHGWPANGIWMVRARDERATVLEATLEHSVQGARLTKRLHVLPSHPFVYQSHQFEGGTGTISVANHAMVTLPGGGLLSFSPKINYRTPKQALESDSARGRSALAYPSETSNPMAFPAALGPAIDITRFPFRHGHEDFVVATEAVDSSLGWTAVVRLGQGDVFLSLRDPRQLPMTMLWHSDCGRDYAPWSARHRHCLGVEEGYAPHMLGETGGMSLAGRLDIRHVIGAISWPTEARVTGVKATADQLFVTGSDGTQRILPFDLSHLFPEGNPL